MDQRATGSNTREARKSPSRRLSTRAALQVSDASELQLNMAIYDSKEAMSSSEQQKTQTRCNEGGGWAKSVGCTAYQGLLMLSYEQSMVFPACMTRPSTIGPQ